MHVRYTVKSWCAYIARDITYLPMDAVASVYAAAHVGALASTALDRTALVTAWLNDAVHFEDYYAGPCFTFALHDVLGVDPNRAVAEYEALDCQIILEAAYRDVILADDVARGTLHTGLRALGYTISGPA